MGLDLGSLGLGFRVAVGRRIPDLRTPDLLLGVGRDGLTAGRSTPRAPPGGGGASEEGRFNSRQRWARSRTHQRRAATSRAEEEGHLQSHSL
jgi:hypothetical protein